MSYPDSTDSPLKIARSQDKLAMLAERILRGDLDGIVRKAVGAPGPTYTRMVPS